MFISPKTYCKIDLTPFLRAYAPKTSVYAHSLEVCCESSFVPFMSSNVQLEIFNNANKITLEIDDNYFGLTL